MATTPYAAALEELAQVLGDDAALRYRSKLVELLRETDGKVDVVLNRYLDLEAKGIGLAVPPSAAAATPVPGERFGVDGTPLRGATPMLVDLKAPVAAEDARVPEVVPVPMPRWSPTPASSGYSATVASAASASAPPAPARAAAMRTPAPTDAADTWPKFLGETIVKAYAMVSGRDKVVVGDDVVLDRDTSSSSSSSVALARTASGSTATPTGPKYVRTSKQRNDNIIVRLLVRGREVGKLSSEAARFVSKLMDYRMVDFNATCVDAPDNVAVMDTIILSLRASLRREAFRNAPGIATGGDERTEELLVERKRAFRTLLAELSLQPLRAPIGFDVDASKLEKGGAPPPGRANTTRETSAAADSAKLLTTGELDQIYQATAPADYDLSEMEPASTMLFTLRPYQKQALRWMMDQETLGRTAVQQRSHNPLWAEYRFPPPNAESSFFFNPASGELRRDLPAITDDVRGGVLADEMGLGKTIEILALVHSHRASIDGAPTSTSSAADGSSQGGAAPRVAPKRKVADMDADDAPRGRADGREATNEKGVSTDRISRATLVVCPMSLLGQWRQEVEASAAPGSMSVLVYYGGDRAGSVQALCDVDVVLTTYGIVSSEYSRAVRDGGSPNGDAAGDPGDGMAVEPVSRDLSGTIFGVRFHRVVLDEAHMIKSRTTNVARGTPVQNRLEDLFSLLCFLRLQPWALFSVWRQFIGAPYEKQDPSGLATLRTVLQPILLRRTKDLRGRDGQPIVSLPDKSASIEYLEFTEPERDFYRAVFTRTKSRFDDFLAAGTAMSHYANIFQMLMRLRQCCDHPFLILGRDRDTAEADTMLGDLEQLVARFVGTPIGPNITYATQVVRELQERTGDSVGAVGEASECPLCLDAIAHELRTPCLHGACQECLLDLVRKAGRAGAMCPVCRVGPIFEKDLLDLNPKKEPTMAETRKEWRPSTKMNALLRRLRESRDDSGNTSKSIVFSQFTTFLDMLQTALDKDGFQFARLDGTLSQAAREQALTRFNADAECTVFLISLRAGGVGLNLTAADHCYLMDLWWNPAVEEQAIDRVHRIGQTRNVVVTRFVVRDTVEERMLGLQSRKRSMVQDALGASKDDERKTRLEDLRKLFS